MRIGEWLRSLVGHEVQPPEVKTPPPVDVGAAMVAIEKAGKTTVAGKNREHAPGGADGHQPLPEKSPVFSVNDGAIPRGETTRVRWIEDCSHPMPLDLPYDVEEMAAIDATLRYPRHGDVLSASYGALNGTVLTVACDDGVVREVDADQVKVSRLADQPMVKWSDDLRPMPGETPFLTGDDDPAWDTSLIFERRGVILATSDTFLGGRQHIVACDDGRVRTVAADHVRSLA